MGLIVSVCHFPPGTSKWNKIEHRLLSFITQNWRGLPLITLAVIVNLIGATKTRTGLRVRVELDKGPIPRVAQSPTRRWPRSTCAPTRSIATGTTPSCPRPKDAIKRLLIINEP